MGPMYFIYIDMHIYVSIYMHISIIYIDIDYIYTHRWEGGQERLSRDQGEKCFNFFMVEGKGCSWKKAQLMQGLVREHGI